MTQEAQRIAIAEACGWNRRTMADGGPLVWHDGEKFRSDYEIPDYLNDLNAMHEAEKGLNEKQLDVMRDFLSDIFKRDYPDRDTIRVWRCAAAQRSEAFLRTLGLWKP